eukprot:3586961-Pleurochrysis_carterae.AAC.3
MQTYLRRYAICRGIRRLKTRPAGAWSNDCSPAMRACTCTWLRRYAQAARVEAVSLHDRLSAKQRV